MSTKGGYRPNAGRKPKDPNAPKVTRPVSETAIMKAGSNLKTGGRKYATALDFLMDVVNNDDLDIRTRLSAATVAVPYQHAKLTEKEVGKKEAKADRAQAATGAALAAADGSAGGWDQDLSPDRRIN